jgi:hypothetical protein
MKVAAGIDKHAIWSAIVLAAAGRGAGIGAATGAIVGTGVGVPEIV